MSYILKFICVGTALCTLTVAQINPRNNAKTAATSNASPVAYVYVSNYVGSTYVSEVSAFSAAANGALKPVEGSPFADELIDMAVNGKYLMGGTDNNIDINAYLIQPDGAISFYTQTNIVKQNDGCGAVGSIFFDHTGASLYNFDYNGGQCANNTYEAFNVVKASGALTFLDEAGDSEGLNGKLSFIGNNLFAYGSTCYHSNPTINGFQRSSNGSLTMLSLNVPYPTAPTGIGWCPYLAAADPTNHVVIPMQPYSGYGSPSGPYQLAVYTADSSGNLTTASTSTNMPTVSVGDVNDVQMAPSGQVIAVGGTTGLQIFHVSGANPITPYAVLDSTDQFLQMFWDNSNHLYALSQTSGKLFVYTVTSTGYSAAPGSPYTINGALRVIVQPLPVY